MTRRHKSRKPLFHTSLLLFAIITALLVTVVGIVLSRYFDRRAQGEGGPPNFIVIMTDDQRYDSMDAMPITTERLGGTGITFTHAYLTTPLCCPSRTSFLTGMYAHNTDIFNNNSYGKVQKLEDRMIPLWMPVDYKTAWFGKYINGYDNKNVPGWDQWFGIGGGRYFDYEARDNNKVRYFGRKASDYSTDVIRRKAVQFIRETDESFFVVVAPQAPHGDNDEGAVDGAVSAPRHRPCSDIAAFQSPALNEEDVSDKPQWVQKIKKKSEKQIRQIEAFRKSQYCALKAVDEMVGEILDTLEQKGIRDNTFIAYYSDNGYGWGEHRHEKKNCIYDGCAKTPMIISYPPLTDSVSGQTTDALLSHIDLTATILDIAEIPVPDQVRGKSIKPILADPTSAVRDSVLIEVDGEYTKHKIFAVRTKEYKYAEHENGERELYDLVNDPYELENQITNAAYTEVIIDLSAKLATLKAE